MSGYGRCIGVDVITVSDIIAHQSDSSNFARGVGVSDDQCCDKTV